MMASTFDIDEVLYASAGNDGGGAAGFCEAHPTANVSEMRTVTRIARTSANIHDSLLHFDRDGQTTFSFDRSRLNGDRRGPNRFGFEGQSGDHAALSAGR